MSGAAEFTRLVDIRQADGLETRIEADAAEREALARRFLLVRINSLVATLALAKAGDAFEARGRLQADVVQSCAVSAEDLPVTIDEDLFFRFVPETTAHVPGEELEINADDCDDIEYSGTQLDLGEAVAQSLALAIDPFLTGPQADAARKAAGIGTPGDSGPFAGLKGLKLGE